jgi:hypothetical protein
MKPKNYKTHDALIASYLEAFKLANPQVDPPQVWAEKGYIRIGEYNMRYTAAHVEEMRKGLLERAAKAKGIRDHGPTHELGNLYESRVVGCGGTWIGECSCGENVKAISEEMARIRFKEHVAEESRL